MAEGLLEDQYDADLTVDDDYEYDGESSYGQEVDDDLFGYATDNDSPISRLKSLILSIEWEITDDILEQFIDELLELKNLWKEHQIRQVYIQALDKIARYIYKEKADAKHNAIKLLLSFYRNLEKIVSDESITSQQAKGILVRDVKKFEALKKEIYPSGQETQVSPPSQSEPAKKTTKTPTEPSAIPVPDFVDEEADKELEPEPAVASTSIPSDSDVLRELKAAVLGIDWEITNQDLARLANEVNQLKNIYKKSKAKIIFLQGIEALGGYIDLKRSEAHAGAFTLLRSFFDGLEKVVSEGLRGEDEKKLLLVRVEKFNKFKTIIAETVPGPGAATTKERVAQPKKDKKVDIGRKTAAAEDRLDQRSDEMAVVGKTALEQMGDGSEGAVSSEIEDRLKGFFDTELKQGSAKKVDSEIALKGVDVESEADDDSDEEPLPMDEEGLAPALSAVDAVGTPDEFISGVEAPVKGTEKTPAKTETPTVKKEEETGGEVIYEIDSKLKNLFESGADEDTSEKVDSEIALKGVDVESEADDDSDEEPLLMDEEDLAPALSAFDEEGVAEKPEVVSPAIKKEPEKKIVSEPKDEEVSEPVVSQEIDSKLENLFDLESDEDASEKIDSETALQGVDVESEADDDSDEEPLPMDEEDLAPALSSFEEKIKAEQPEAEKTELQLAKLTEEIDEKSIPVQKQDESPSEDVISEIDEKLKGFFESESDERPDELIDKEIALKGVAVESEADDDSDEEPLPEDERGLAPALSALDELGSVEEGIHEEIEAESNESIDDELTPEAEEELEPALFSIESGEPEEAPERAKPEETPDEGLSAIDDIAPALSEDYEEIAPAFSEEHGESPFDEALAETQGDETDINELTQVMLLDDDEKVSEDASTQKYKSVEDEEFVGLEGIPGFGSDEIVEEGRPEGETGIDAKDRLDEFFRQEKEDKQSVEKVDLATDIEQSEISEQIEPAEGTGKEFDLLFSSEEREETVAKEEISPEPDKTLEAEDIFHMDDVALIDEVEKEPEEDVEKEGAGLDKAAAFRFDEKDKQDAFAPVDDGDTQGQSVGEEVVFEPVDTDEYFEKEIVFQEVKEDEDDIDIDIEGFEEEEQESDDEFLFFDEIEERKTEVKTFDGRQETAIGAKEDSRLISDQKRTSDVDAGPSLERLEECIASIGVEVTDELMRNIVHEINRLTPAFKENATERKFVSLLSTVLRQVKQSRYGVRSATYTLLQSIFDKLDYVVSSSLGTPQAQELLLDETLKVLLWQQTMLDVRADNEEAKGSLTDFDDFDDGTDFDEKFFKMNEMDDDVLKADDVVNDHDAEVSDKISDKFKALRDDMKSEVDGLRKDLGKD